jgi:small subunit ribosomal protein S6
LLQLSWLRLDIHKEDDLAENRVYEVLFIVDPETPDEETTRLTEYLRNIVTEQGGTVTKAENMGRRQLAYRIGRRNEGVYVLFEVEGTGREIAELERRMRVSDQVMRYITVRVDEDRQRAEKLKGRRVRKASKRPGARGAAAGAGGED